MVKHMVVMMNQKGYESFDFKLVARHESKTYLLPELELIALYVHRINGVMKTPEFEGYGLMIGLYSKPLDQDMTGTNHWFGSGGG